MFGRPLRATHMKKPRGRPSPGVGASLMSMSAAVSAAISASKSVSASLSASVFSGAAAIAPSYDSPLAELPGVVAGTFAVGTAMLLDFGSPINSPNPAGYSYQVYRNGEAIAGAFGANKTSPQSYTPVANDEGKIVSFSVIATNSAGSSAAYYAPGEVIGPAV